MLSQNKHILPLTIAPSLPAESFAQLEGLVNDLAGTAQGFQIDIVDGKFVPHTSWPFTEADVNTELLKILSLPQSLEWELDCMIERPEQYLQTFAQLPLSKLIIHIGSTDRYNEIITHARVHDYQIGLAFTNDIPLSFLYPYISKIDFVQVMGIAQVGVQGQPFDEHTLETVQTLREQFPELSIAVDGAVNAETIPKLIAVGVNHFAPGSAISKASDPVLAYKQLRELLT